MLTLRFNNELLAKDVCAAIAAGATEAMERFLRMVKLNMKSNDFELEETIIDMASEKITKTCVFYAKAILESYGRGQQMDMFNPYLQEYFGNVALGWNPARKGKKIVGRPKGTYINFLGETAYSTGEYEGKVTSRDVGYVVQPTRAIQNAEKRLEEGLRPSGFAMKTIQEHTQNFFDTFDSSKYFYNEEISV